MILIAGDSWAEFYHKTYSQIRPDSIGISRGGNSNNQSLSDLEIAFGLGLNAKNKISRVILWLTCVLRDYPPEHPIKDIDQWVTRHYENIFDRAITLAHFHKCHVKLIGGLGDIPRSFPAKLSSRVNIELYSASKLVDPEYKYEMPYGHITQVDRIPDPEQRQKLLEYVEPKSSYMNHRRDLYPDAGHLGPDQNKKIYDFLHNVQSKI
jgi:hypothetical protein